MATADKLTYLNETKNKIRKAIESEKLVTIDDNTTFREYADKIKSTNEEIKKYIPTDSQNGTSLQVTNAVPLNAKKGVIDGNSYQYTTKGNQLVDFSKEKTSSAGVTWNFENDILTISSETGTTGYKLVQYDITDLYINNSGKTMKFSDSGYSTDDISLNPGIQLIIRHSDGTANGYHYLKNYRTNSLWNYTIPEDTSNISSVSLGVYTNNTANAVANKLTIEKPLLYFDNNNEYEKYTGGIASPNPDYPQEIEVVSGKNIFNIEEYPFKNKVAFGNVGEQVNWAGYCGIEKYFPIEENTTYTFSNSTKKGIYYGLVCYDENKSILSYTKTDLKTFTTPKGCKYIRFSMQSTIPEWVQLEKGSIATKYVPYNNLLLTKSGKNIIEPIMQSVTYLGITCTNNGDGSFTLNGTAEKNCDFRINQKTRGGISNLKKYNGTYTLSCNELVENVKVNVMQEGTWATPLSISSTNKVKTATLNNMENMFVFIYILSGTTLDNLTLRPQLEKGSNATEYEPYHKDEYLIDLKGNFLAKIGDVKDTLDLTSGVLNKNIKKIVLDGSENWTMLYGDGMFQFIAPIKTIARKKSYSDHFIYNPVQASIYKSLKDGEFAIQLYSTNNTFFIKHMEFDNVADFKNWLSNNNVTIYYQVAEPETIQLAPTNIKMYEGTNNIELDTNLETNISLDYYKDFSLDSQEVEVSEVTE